MGTRRRLRATAGTRAAANAAAAASRSASRWFWPTLAVIIATAAIGRFLVLAEYWQRNPLATHLLQDAATYWAWAEGIAQGRLVGAEPFFSAPLYPYLLAVLRAVGGGLHSVYVGQALVDLVTAVLLAHVARPRFGTAAALWATGLFLLLTEPASYSPACPVVYAATAAGRAGVVGDDPGLATADRSSGGRRRRC